MTLWMAKRSVIQYLQFTNPSLVLKLVDANLRLLLGARLLNQI